MEIFQASRPEYLYQLVLSEITLISKWNQTGKMWI